MDYLNSIPGEYLLYGCLGIILIGIILGFTKTITVYRDYADLTKVFMLVIAPVGLYFILGDKIKDHILSNILIVIEGILLIWILFTTFMDNRNVFKTLLAFITKIPMGVIFTIYLLNLISPGGKSLGQRRQNRGLVGIVMLFLGPILYGLVKKKVWIYNKSGEEK